MGLLDSVLGSIAQRGTGNAMFDSVLAMVNDPARGGLEGLVRSFREEGLGGIVDSWVSTGQNLPISADQIEQGLGSEKLASMAGRLGLSQDELSSKLAEILPSVVDRLTPEGRVPDANSLGGLLDALKNRLG